MPHEPAAALGPVCNMTRLLLLFHRYLGIAIGALMVMWCISGVVMMYASYPALAENRRLKQLAPIDWNGCCTISDEALSDTDPVRDFRIEMLAGRPVLYLGTAESAGLIDLMTGTAIRRVASRQAADVAESYATQEPQSKPRLLGLIDYDQWTVSGGLDAARPLYHFRFSDRMSTELYVSSTTGQVVQMTSGRERFWNWFGAVPHWLYFAQLRRKAALWSELVIAMSLIGCFLATTGIYLGVRQLRRQPGGHWSPYCGFKLWHHIAGLAFGLLTLSWVLSGLLSVNPWGWLEGSGAQPESARLRGPELSGAQVRSGLQALIRTHAPNMVSIHMAPLDGRLYFRADLDDGARRRLDASATINPLNDSDLAYIADRLTGPNATASPTLITREDTYYFSHHRDLVQLPVYRLASRDGSGTAYYIDPVSGSLVGKIDSAARGYRWWHQGLHRLDFVPALRARPQWDILMLFLMAGVTIVCATGAYLGCRRLMRSQSDQVR